MPTPSNSPERPPAAGASRWSCPRCTFDNPSSAVSCEICEGSRLVEIDADSPAPAAAASAPLRPCGRKKERAESPDAAASTRRERAVESLYVDAATSNHRCGKNGERAESPDGAASTKSERAESLDVAAATPIQRCGKKREPVESPDVVELCDGPSGGGDGNGKAPAVKRGKTVPSYTGNLETHFDKRTFKIMTYNVWFREDLELSRRMDALGELIKHHSPDFICFQEVTPCIYLLLQKSGWWKEYKCLLPQEKAIGRPYYCMQLSKVPVKPSENIPFLNSIMGRELCVTSVRTGEITNLVVATTHLESPCPAPPKWDQMYSRERVTQANTSLENLRPYRNAILCGDMNWDDKGDGPFPLPDGWIDAWVELKPGKEGWTYDTKANGMLSANRKMQKRLDRFVCKLEDFRIDSIEMIGTEAIPGVSYLKEKKVRKEIRKVELPVFPSDHFGLILTVSQLDDDNL